MSCRVSDDHTESYLSATRSQPSCSNRVNSSLIFVTVMMLSRLRIKVDRPLRRAETAQSTVRFAQQNNDSLLQRKFDWLFFFARNQLVSLNNSSASIPTKQCIIVAGRTNCFRFFKPAHRFAKKLVRLKSAAGCILRQFCFSPTLCEDSCVIRTLIFAFNSRQKIFGLCITYAVAFSETIG